MTAVLGIRSLLTGNDLEPEQFLGLVDSAARLRAAKRRRTRGAPPRRAENIALIFQKNSTRTRAAFEVAAYDQGAHVTFLGPERIASSVARKASPILPRVLGRLYDGIEFRGFAQDVVENSPTTPACRCGTG